ncbi:MAG: transporter substrate-binding domain-containing protein [Clostridia bacterium]
MKKILAIALVLVLALGVFAACSSSADTDTEAETTEAETTEAETTEVVKVIDIKLTEEEYAFGVDKDQEDLLESVNTIIADIKADGTFDEICNKYFGDGEPTAVYSAEEDSSVDQLLVATNAAFEPFEYTEGDAYYGIDMEIAQIIADELGLELVIKNMEFSAVCLSVGNGTADIAMAGLTVNEERTEYVTFSDSYYEASQKLVVAADDTTFDECTTADEVIAILNTYGTEVSIGYQNGTTGNFFVEGDADWGFDGFATTNSGYSNGSLAISDLINGNIDYVIIDEAPAEAIVASLNELA